MMIFIVLGLVYTLIAIGYLKIFSNFETNIIVKMSVGAFVLGGIFAYLGTPTLGVFEPGLWTFLIFPIAVCFFCILMSERTENFKLLIWSFVGFLGVFALFAFVSTSAMIHSAKYYALLDVVEEQEFDPTTILLDQSKARFVDQSLSVRSANEILGQVRGMGSRYEIGTMRIQNMNNELKWVAPFQHTTFFKWLDNGTSPGYVSVSSSNYSDATMHIKNNDINYGVSGFYFNKNVDRHLYINGYAGTLLDDFTLEIDDEGNPYWVVSMLERKVGFSGKVATGVVVVNAKNGDFEEYTIDEVPSWINRVQPESVVDDLITNWGKYADGWWNGVVVGDGVIIATPGTSLVFTKDQTSSWYTGMQSNSATNKESTMGFMIVSSRTGKATFYQRSGITESVAQSAIEGRVQEAGYSASNPIPYNINGQVTFMSILKDDSGNMQGIGLVAYDDRSKVAIGENFDIALRRYLSTLAERGGIDNLDASVEVIEVSGSIDRAYLQSFDNRLILNFTLSGNDYQGQFFIAQADSNKEIMLSREGDKVNFKTYSLDNQDVQVFDFNNLTF
jgi:hypothetical protein